MTRERTRYSGSFLIRWVGMQKLKPVMPSLREKKRYLAFEVLSDAKLDTNHIAKAVMNASLQFAGELGTAEMGIIPLTELFAKNKGIIRVSNVGLDRLKAALTLITTIEGHPVSVRSLAVSGNLGKMKKAI